MASKPEYDRFEAEAAEQIRQQQAATAAAQAQAERFMDQGEGDVKAGQDRLK